jgi:YHS domain-containing protein
VLLFACSEKPKTEMVILKTSESDSVRKKYTADMVDNKKDPSCGMPMAAGIEDTVHYMGKVYGFCSDECKQIFLKNPNTLAKNAEMKN